MTGLLWLFTFGLLGLGHLLDLLLIPGMVESNNLRYAWCGGNRQVVHVEVNNVISVPEPRGYPPPPPPPPQARGNDAFDFDDQPGRVVRRPRRC